MDFEAAKNKKRKCSSLIEMETRKNVNDNIGQHLNKFRV